MKILFLVSSLGHGRGGHIHSLNHIAGEIGKYQTIEIVSFGKDLNPVLSNNAFYKGSIDISKGYFKINSQLRNKLKEFKPDIIHCFDDTVLPLILGFPVIWKYRVVWTRCGGQNPNFKRNLKAHHMICFSKENHDWYSNNKHFRNSNIYLVPNRVKKIKLPTSHNHPFKKDILKFNFVRIARIGKSYEEGFWKILNLIERLKDDYPINLYIIGVIEKEDLYEELTKYILKKELPVQFITDDIYTKNAVNLLGLADCVIGTGRSLMEATSLALPVMAFAKNYETPVLVTKNNIDFFADYNFSERTLINTHIRTHANNTLIEIIKDLSKKIELGNEMYKLYKIKFDVSIAVERYKEVYTCSLKVRKRQFFFYNLPFILRSIYRLKRY